VGEWPRAEKNLGLLEFFKVFKVIVYKKDGTQVLRAGKNVLYTILCHIVIC